MASIYKVLSALIILVLLALNACSFSYSFTGSDIPANAKTFSVEYFQNNAPLADPDYPQLLTEDLKDLMIQQSPLKSIKERGDIAFSGSIDQFFIAPVAISGNETAERNRLTVGITVQYINVYDEEKNFEKNFNRFADFDNTVPYETVRQSLLNTINEQLVQDIFNASVGNW